VRGAVTYEESLVPAREVRFGDRLVNPQGEKQPPVFVNRARPGCQRELWLDPLGTTRIELGANTPVKVMRRVTHLVTDS